MTFKIAVLPGDGIGPEVTCQAVHILRAVSQGQFDFQFEELPIGGIAVKKFGTPLPEKTLEKCLASDAVLLGAVGGPEFDSLPPAQKPETGLLAIRKALGGFANLRPAIAYDVLADCSPLRPEVLKGADILFVRELLGGVYFGQPRGFAGEGASRSGFNTMVYSVSTSPSRSRADAATRSPRSTRPMSWSPRRSGARWSSRLPSNIPT
jgi:3-isopropylmalate dehydrogenase